VTPPRVEVVPADRAAVYLRRAENLLKVMEIADQAGNPDGIVNNAIQAGIALGDAFTVFSVQRRSRGQDHSEALLLVRECLSPRTPEVASLLQRILNRRSELLYASHEVSLRHARELAGLTRKLQSVVRSAIP
jgi:hypothetical protein